jgi:hypothetical protein
MRKQAGFIIAVTFAAILVTGIAGPAHALGGYLAWQDSKDADTGFGFGLKQKYQIVPVVALEGRATWIAYGDENFGTETGSLNAFPLEVVARAKLGILYGGAGLGYVFFSGPEGKPDGDVTTTILGGGEFSLLGLGAFAELQYRFLEPEASGAKVDLSGFGVNAGVLFRW